MKVRQSTLQTWQKCPLIVKFEQIDGLEREQSGSLVFGSIIHDCVLWMEVNQDVEGAVSRFHRFWRDPTLLDPPPGNPEYRIDYYVRGTNWKKFKEKGEKILRDWWSIISWDTALTLAREYSFEVPIGTQGNTLVGTVDKLEVKYRAKEGTFAVVCSDYKGLALDTRLVTPTGWTTMRDVQVGGQVIGGDGLPCRVTAKSERHLRDCYRITFDDGSSVVADNEHLWQVVTRDGDTKVLATEELARNLFHPITKQRHLRIPNVTTHLPVADLPIDPYVLGVWLGDGSVGCGVVTKPHPELFNEIERRGFEVGPLLGNGGRTVYGLRGPLADLGVLRDKHIPDSYLRASVAQRLDLLRGIMDTDGHWNATRKRCVLNTTDQRFATQVYELAVSLGWKAATFTTTATGFGKSVPAWQTWFTPVDEDVFLARRPDNYRRTAPTKSRRRLIMSVERVPTVETQCITVDSPENTYLCGDQMVETHNTNNKVPTYDYLEENIQFSAYSYATTRPEFWANLPGGRGMELFEEYRDLPRYGEWVQLVSARRMDAGIRTQRHYNRVAMAVDAMAESMAMRLFVPTISGESCRYCEFRKPCGLPELDEDGNQI